ncbi:MAG: hypothetical protein ACR2ND_06825 [Solirubrobacteraceae bacterium]
MPRFAQLICLLAACCVSSFLVAIPIASAGVVPGGVVDGPNPDILAVGGVALGPDATGGVVYVRNDQGAAHIFVASLTAGVWSAPQRLDGGLIAPSSQPVIAAASNGRLAVAFLNAGTLYGVVRTQTSAPFGGPQPISVALSDPAIAMGLSGAAYVSWTAPHGNGTDVDVARLDRTSATFAPFPAPLSASPALLPGKGGVARSRVAVSADGTGLISWAENNPDGKSHVLVKRVFGGGASAAPIDLTLGALDGHGGGSADSAVVGLQDDSSYGWASFREIFDNGGGVPVERVVLRPLLGDQPQAAQGVDGLSFPASEGAEAPSISIDALGDGLVAAQLQSSHQVIGAGSAGSAFTPGQRLNAGNYALAPMPATAISRDGTGIVAFAADLGSIRGKLYDGGTPGDEVQLSRNEFGQVDPQQGLSAAADDGGDVIVGYLQGDPANHRVAVADVVTPPVKFKGLTSQKPIARTRPTLSWEPAKDSWSAVSYTVTLDGRTIGRTKATRLHVPARLKRGTHRWQVSAVDSLGQTTRAPTRVLRIGSKQAKSGHPKSGAKRKSKRAASKH